MSHQVGGRVQRLLTILFRIHHDNSVPLSRSPLGVRSVPQWIEPVSTLVKHFWRYQKTFGKIFLEDISPFVGSLIPLFCTSGDVFSGFQIESGQPYSYLAEVCVTCSLRFTSGATPANLPCTGGQALVELETGTYHAADECSTNWALSVRLKKNLT